MEMTAVEFKTKCIEVMEHVKEDHEEVIITQEGTPVAKLVPYEDDDEDPVSLFGYMKGSVKINGNIIDPIDEKWEAEF
ncbi:MAG: hypothetical protein QG657_777 [Acidobacteriota bacterium]|nr:hypothetical protein [Acidobacteriota bacterium]